MARSRYLYLIWADGDLLSGHTVKHEAFTWCERSGLGPEDVHIDRIRDGVTEPGKKKATKVDWPTT